MNDTKIIDEAARMTEDAKPAAGLPTRTVHATPLAADNAYAAEEKAKTAQERAEDTAYTINHALSCGTTDVILQPAIAAAFGVNVGCNAHDHHEHPKHGKGGHTHAKPKLTFKTFAHEAGHYLKGEIIGDFAAVPLTIAVQRHFPGFMHGIRTLTEPVFGWAFRSGANRAARHWANERNLDPESPEVKAHAAQIYEHEIAHLPQAVVWNMFAYPIGAVGQKMGGHGRSYPEIFKSKLVGAAISNGLLIGGRMIAPGAAQRWDQMTGQRVFEPVATKAGALFGVDADTMARARHKQTSAAPGSWTNRVDAAPTDQPEPALARP